MILPLAYKEYSIEKSSRDSMSQLSELFLKARNIRIEPAYFIEKNNPEYTGRKYVGIFAFDQKRQPVAFYGQFPCTVIIHGVEYPAVQSGDVVTHPDHQRQGLFSAMGGYARVHAGELGTAFMFCSPNENSTPGFVRSLGWYIAAHFKKYQWKVRTIPLYRIAGKLRLNKLYHLYVSMLVWCCKLDPNEFLGDTQRTGLNTVFKSKAYFKYKNTYNQSYLIQWRGVKIWFKLNYGLLIGELETDEGTDIDKVVRSLKSLSRILGTEQVIFQTAENGIWHQRLSPKYPSSEGLPICFNPMEIEMNPHEFVLTAADVDTF